MQFMLQCGHVVLTMLYPESIMCPHCECVRKVVAVECRQWHAKCLECRWGRWFGQDENSARLAHRHHDVDVSFQIYEPDRKLIRSYYGNSVRVHFGRSARNRVKPVSEIRPLFERDDSEVPPF